MSEQPHERREALLRITLDDLDRYLHLRHGITASQVTMTQQDILNNTVTVRLAGDPLPLILDGGAVAFTSLREVSG